MLSRIAIKTEPVERLLFWDSILFLRYFGVKVVNKKVLMQAVSRSTGLSLRETSACIDSIFEAIGEAISQGDKVELRGFGTFFTKSVLQKKHPCSFSNQTVTPAHGKIAFRPCQKLRESAWNKVKK